MLWWLASLITIAGLIFLITVLIADDYFENEKPRAASTMPTAVIISESEPAS